MKIDFKSLYEYSENTHCWRLVFSILYLVGGILIIFLFRGKMFYPHASFEAFWNFHRFLWCISCSCIGLSGIAFLFRKEKEPPIPKYIFNYPINVIARAALAFSAVHLIPGTNNYLFYYLSGSISFLLGYFIDDLNILGKVFSR